MAASKSKLRRNKNVVADRVLSADCEGLRREEEFAIGHETTTTAAGIGVLGRLGPLLEPNAFRRLVPRVQFRHRDGKARNHPSEHFLIRGEEKIGMDEK